MGPGLTSIDWNVWSLLLMLTSKWNKIKIQPLNLIFSLHSGLKPPSKSFLPSFPIKYYPNLVQPSRLRKESAHRTNIFFNFLEGENISSALRTLWWYEDIHSNPSQHPFHSSCRVLTQTLNLLSISKAKADFSRSSVGAKFWNIRM